MPENGTARQIELMTVIIISILVSFVTSVITSFFTFVFLKKISKKSKKRTNESKEENKVINSKAKHHTEVPITQERTEDVNSTVSTQEKGSDSSKEEVQQPKEKKLSKKQQQKLLRKEERAQKREEKVRREEELAEEKRRKTFNPKVSIPENAIFSELAVSDGHLVSCAVGQTAYYRSWEYDGKRYFEFYCEPSKAPKAFNNRSVIIDPFCLKDNDSIPVDEAKTFTTLEYGEIDANLNILSKSLVRFDK